MGTTRKTAEKASGRVRKAVRPRRTKVTHKLIETRAYLISLGDTAASADDNWLTAERELLGG
jgi:hypothetical protein